MDSVLIVDDSLTVRMDLSDAFTAAGFRVLLAGTAAEALSTVEREKVRAVILDVQLPDGDGLDLLEKVQAKVVPRPAVVLLSTRAEVAHRIRGLRTGADDYVGKPYDTSYLVARLRELIRARAEEFGSKVPPVLVIDDSVTYRHALETALTRAGYTVITAASGEEGLRLAANRRPSLILVDGVMGGIDGATVIRRIRLDAALRTTPCILLTASHGPDAELGALEAGADAFVRKEEDLEVILLRLAAVLRNGSNVQEGPAASLLDAKRILAVDDSATYLQELSTILQGEGYDVIMAHSGEEALDLLAAQDVDCILLDLVMPGIDGIETCRRVKASPVARDIPLILMTAREDREALISGFSTGADDFISKSNEFEVLKARVRAQLRRKQFEDEHRRVREQLLRSEIEAAEARAAHELADTRAALVEELKTKNSEVEAAYRELQAAQAQLVQSAKMASLGELVAGVAHEINNPLAFVLSHLDTARRSLGELRGRVLDGGSSSEQRHWERAENRLFEMGIGLERIRELVVKLRTFSRLDEGEVKTISVRESIDSVLTIVGHRLKDHIEVTTRYCDPDLCECYPSLLNQALLNLISNAIEAIEKEGTLSVETQCEADDFRIIITDSGHGIPKAIVERVLEPFFTTKPVGQGTGLGLSITDSIVRKHRGTLVFEDAPVRGTRVTMTLPRRQPT
jgi:DNA-binding response OmpR family regulator/anti-sigma regulatory factor (Ser/Thr protein kinase)